MPTHHRLSDKRSRLGTVAINITREYVHNIILYYRNIRDDNMIFLSSPIRILLSLFTRSGILLYRGLTVLTT